MTKFPTSCPTARKVIQLKFIHYNICCIPKSECMRMRIPKQECTKICILKTECMRMRIPKTECAFLEQNV